MTPRSAGLRHVVSRTVEHLRAPAEPRSHLDAQRRESETVGDDRARLVGRPLLTIAEVVRGVDGRHPFGRWRPSRERPTQQS